MKILFEDEDVICEDDLGFEFQLVTQVTDEGTDIFLWEDLQSFEVSLRKETKDVEKDNGCMAGHGSFHEDCVFCRVFFQG